MSVPAQLCVSYTGHYQSQLPPYSYTETACLNQGAGEHRLGLREKYWDKLAEMLEFPEKFVISHEILREYLSGN